MTNDDFNAKLVGQLLLHFDFPTPVTTAVTPPGITKDEQLVFAGKARSVWVTPPLGNGIGSKCRGVV